MSSDSLRNFPVSSTNFNHRHRRDIGRRNQRRIQRQRRRITRMHNRRRAPITLLSQTAQLPLQIANDPFTYQFFNGFPFY